MSLREMEHASIRSFVESCSEHFTGRVLDYGCGVQPYRSIIEAAGGKYHGYDRPGFGGSTVTEPVLDADWSDTAGGEWDAILCTQVLQYVPRPQTLLIAFEHGLTAGGALVLTYPTSWPEVEEADLHRFTRPGMTRLLTGAGFVIERHERRAQIEWQGEVFALGYGVFAQAT